MTDHIAGRAETGQVLTDREEQERIRQAAVSVFARRIAALLRAGD